MKDFDSIKDMWQQQLRVEKNDIDIPAFTAKTAGIKTKLMRQQLRGSILLFATTVYIAWIGFFSAIHFKLAITYIAIVIMLAVIMVQAVIGLYILQQLKKIDDTLLPAAHLQQWEDYFMFRKKQLHWNKPLYFIFLNLAFGLYFIEVLGGRSLLWNTFAITIYLAWMLFAYRVLGRRAMAKEENRIKNIIDNLEQLNQQLTGIT